MLITILLSSCSIEKRVHLSGHHVEWFHEGKSNRDIQQDLNANRPDKTTSKSTETTSKSLNSETVSSSEETLNFSQSQEAQDNFVQQKSNSTMRKHCPGQKGSSEKTIGHNISNPVFNPISNTPIDSSNQPVTNGKALTGFICSLAGLFAFGSIFGTIAIIFSAIGLSKIKKDPIKWKGKGMAIAGLVIGIVDIIASLLLLALIL